MIADLKPYSKYKDSGLPWLGQVPGHWEMRPAFGVFISNQERNRGMKEKTVLSLSYGRIVVKPVEKLHGLVPESFETYQIVSPGDIVLRTTDLQNDHTSLRVGMVRDRGIITSAYLALRVHAGINPEFGFQVLNVWDLSKAIYGYGSGLRQNLDFSHFKRMPVAVPPPDEQGAIVRFLDHATHRLDKAIRAKRKTIGLLNEQKQVIIHRAVTRGLAPDVPLKDSGLYWMGQIPVHWEVVRIKTILHESNQRSSDGTELLLSLTRRRGLIPFNEVSKRPHSAKTLVGYKNYHQGQIVMNRMQAWSGMFGAGQFDGIISPDYAAFDVLKGHNSDFVLERLKSPDMVGQFALASTGIGSGFNRLYTNQFGSISISLPPISEQSEIIKLTFEATLEIGAAISRLEREIELLREYRTRLINDVVTGKLDVREAAVCLPQEAAPDAINDDTDLGDEIEPTDEEAIV